MREIALVTRAKGLAGHLLRRDRLERLCEAHDLESLGRGLGSLPMIEPVTDLRDVFAFERAVARTAHRCLDILYRWQERTPGVLDIFAAHQDRRSLRALVRGAAAGAPLNARLDGLLPTPTLPRALLASLAREGSAAAVVRQLVLAAHPDAPRLLLIAGASQPDLLAIDVALLRGFEERAARAAAASDDAARQFVRDVVELGKTENAQLAAGTDVAHLDRAFLLSAIARLTKLARLDPLGSAPLLRTLLLVEAQSHDLRALAWGAMLGTPPTLRRQALVTPP